MVGYDPMFSGLRYIEEIKKQEDLTTEEIIKKYGRPALYRDYYPAGYSSCVKDQRCRGNPDPNGACALLFQGDASQIKKEAGMGKSVIGDLLSGDNCSHVFKNTRLGPKMQSTSVEGSVIVSAIVGDPTGPQGGTKVIDPRSQAEQIPGYVDDVVKKAKEIIPDIPNPFEGMGWMKYLLPIVIILVVIMIFLVVLGYSGLGPAAGSHMMKK